MNNQLTKATLSFCLKEGANSESPKAVTDDGDAVTGIVILNISEGLVSSLVEPYQNGTNKTLQTAVVGRKRATKALELVPSS